LQNEARLEKTKRVRDGNVWKEQSEKIWAKQFGTGAELEAAKNEAWSERKGVSLRGVRRTAPVCDRIDFKVACLEKRAAAASSSALNPDLSGPGGPRDYAFEVSESHLRLARCTLSYNCFNIHIDTAPCFTEKQEAYLVRDDRVLLPEEYGYLIGYGAASVRGPFSRGVRAVPDVDARRLVVNSMSVPHIGAFIGAAAITLGILKPRGRGEDVAAQGSNVK
jgi:hypothetical protein